MSGATRREALAGFAVNLETWWTGLPPLERVAAAARAGFSAVELWFWPRWEVDALARACRAHGLEVAQVGGWDFEPRLSDPAVLPRFRRGIEQAVDVAHRLGTGRVNLNGPVLEPGEDPARVRAQVVEAIAAVAPVAEDAGVTLMVEPMNTRVDHPGYALPTSADVVAVCEGVGSPAVGVNWDLYHLQISEGDLCGHLDEGIDHVAYVQVADHPGRHEPGTGEIDHAFVLDHLRRLGHDGLVGLECTPRHGEDAAVARVAALGSALARRSRDV